MRFTLIDGGMGRELMRIGAPFRQPEWSALALLEEPAWVMQAHTNFIDAGADVVTTNSYALVPFHIGEELFSERGAELAALSGELARQAAAAAPHRVTVAGSLPPLFGSYRPDLFSAVDAPRIIDPLIAGLDAHVDVWLAETLGSIAEVHAVRDAVDRAASVHPLWISYTLDDGSAGLLRSGEAVVAAVRAAIDSGAQAVLFNCSQAERITESIAIAANLVPSGVAVGGYANRFVSGHTSENGANAGLSGLRDLSPIVYRNLVVEWLELGATLVGGCCGIEPAHIAELDALRRS